MQTAIPTVLMRGGTSKGLYFLGRDLPLNITERDRILLAALGSPDDRQIDGVGGAHPLTSKVAIVTPSEAPEADVDYLFLQVVVDRAEVSDGQNCGNILAGVGPFAIENNLVPASDGETEVRIRLVNSGGLAIARVKTPNKVVTYQGDSSIDGVPGTAAPVMLDFLDVAGSTCGSLLPTGNIVDEIDGIRMTCIDNGMPVVVMSAADFGKSGYETPVELESDKDLKARVESIRLKVGHLMNLGDVQQKTMPKMTLVSAPKRGGTICTRSFIPHRVHEAVGVLGAASVAVACLIPGSLASEQATASTDADSSTVAVEHPTGSFSIEVEVSGQGDQMVVHRSALLRTARKLMQGQVFVPAPALDG
ncbi:MAG: 4-oxalomesaconate tautomerase [bacterium]|nr:4-oxalomesaconate tautomerase [Gammaproteobacteria bacterium]HIL96155.1 4-oxalomesaconate tautomerase [Pseudomonadales bacterium]